MRLKNLIQLTIGALILSLSAMALAQESAGPGPNPDRLEKMFRNLDKNADGQIDLKEFVEHKPLMHRQMRRGGPPSPERDMELPRHGVFEERINELIEQRVNEILDRKMHEIVERMVGPMGPGRGLDKDRPCRPCGRCGACPFAEHGPKPPCFDRPPCEGLGPRWHEEPKGPRGWDADRPGRGFGQKHEGRGQHRGGRRQRQHKPMFRMFDTDADGKINAQEIDRWASELKEKLGVQEGGEITLEDWNQMTRERIEEKHKEKMKEKE